MAIPQIVSGSLVESPNSGAKIDAGAFRGAALAQGQVGAAAGNAASDFFGDVGQKIQANRNAGTMFKADLAMRTAKDDFDAQLHKMPDETTWLPAWKSQADAVRDQVLSGPNVGPDVKRVLSQKLDMWQQATTSETKIAALVRGAKNTREDAITDATYIASHATSDEHLKSAVAVYDHAVDVFAMTRQEADKHIAKLPGIAAQSMADNIIASNPIKAPDLIKKFEGQMEPRMYLGVMRHANEARNVTQANNLRDVLSSIGQSPDGTYDMDLLKQQRTNGDITQMGYNSAVALMDKSRTAETKQQFALGRLDAYDHDWLNDKTPAENARKLKDQYGFLPEKERVSLFTQIDAHVAAAKKQGDAIERPIERQVLDQMKEDRNEQGIMIPFTEKQAKGDTMQFSHRIEGGMKALKNPMYYTDEQIKQDFGPSATREKIMEAEKLHAAQMFEKMREWFRDPANKDATIEQANKARQNFERPWIMSAVARVARKQPRLVRQNGKTYNFDTGEEVK